MKFRVLLYLSLLIALLISCSDDSSSVAPMPEAKPVYLQNFSGITETNEAGELLGNEDANDWNLYVDTTDVNWLRKGIEDGIPVDLKVYSAYPNPATDSTNLNISIPDTCKLEQMDLIDEEGNIVREIVRDKTMIPGVYAITIDSLPEIKKLYRCVYKFSKDSLSYWGYGDIEVK